MNELQTRRVLLTGATGYVGGRLLGCLEAEGFRVRCLARRIVDLGGLGDPDEVDSAHLRSRHQVGAILRSGPVPVIELRASIVIGPGSLSFEMIRALVERLPVMVTPMWAQNGFVLGTRSHERAIVDPSSVRTTFDEELLVLQPDDM